MEMIDDDDYLMSFGFELLISWTGSSLVMGEPHIDEPSLDD